MSGDSWEKYTEYDKFEYDLLLFDGTQINNVYPNDGKFYIVHTPSKTFIDCQILEEEVEFIRLAKNPLLGIN
jgi:hypothetical protein